jgi:hypothetical protein
MNPLVDGGRDGFRTEKTEGLRIGRGFGRIAGIEWRVTIHPSSGYKEMIRLPMILL